MYQSKRSVASRGVISFAEKPMSNELISKLIRAVFNQLQPGMTGRPRVGLEADAKPEPHRTVPQVFGLTFWLG